MAESEIIRFRVSADEKAELVRRSQKRNTTLSETIRLDLKLDTKELTPLEQFRLGRERAREELASSGLPELSQDEIVAYCASVRQQRADAAVAAYA